MGSLATPCHLASGSSPSLRPSALSFKTSTHQRQIWSAQSSASATDAEPSSVDLPNNQASTGYGLFRPLGSRRAHVANRPAWLPPQPTPRSKPPESHIEFPFDASRWINFPPPASGYDAGWLAWRDQARTYSAHT